MCHIFLPSPHVYEVPPQSVGQDFPISTTGGGASGPYSLAVIAAIDNLHNKLQIHEY